MDGATAKGNGANGIWKTYNTQICVVNSWYVLEVSTHFLLTLIHAKIINSYHK